MIPYVKIAIFIKNFGKSGFLLVDFMNDNDIFEKFQSVFHSIHSTKPALIKALNYPLCAANYEYCSFLVLDQGSAFDTADHKIVIQRLEDWVGIGQSSGLAEPILLPLIMHPPL